MPQGIYLPEGQRLHTEKNKQGISSLAGLERALSEGQILEARAVLCDAAHNLIVELGTLTGTIPRDEAAIGIAEGRTRDIAVISRVGRPVCFKVTAITTNEDGRPRIVLSRRAAQQEALAYLLENLLPGDVIRAHVTHLEPFGAFVDAGCGIPSLIGIENISVSRISHPADRLLPGDDICAAVLKIDRDTQRISLTHKELLGTWSENAALFSPGETIQGIIRGIESYGIFIELTPNLSGLAEYRDGLCEGAPVAVYIKSILPERMKIKLVIISALEAKSGTPARPQYFIREGRISRWRYTPECAARAPIETIFM